MREFFTIAIFKIKADIRMNKTTLNSQKEKHSMLSLRRATFIHHACHLTQNISIHALLAESDCACHRRIRNVDPFYPRSPCGERLKPVCEDMGLSIISIHALRKESDVIKQAQK